MSPTEVRHAHPEAPRRRLRVSARPKRLDQPVARDGPARTQGQQYEQRPLLRTGDLEPPSLLVDHFECPEKADLHSYPNLTPVDPR